MTALTSISITPVLVAELRAEGDEELVELRELFGHPAFHAGEGTVERFLRWIELMQDQHRLAVLFLEGDGGGGRVVAFFVGPDEARVRDHFEVSAEERHGLRVTEAEHEAVFAPDTNIRLAGNQGLAHRLRCPP